MLQTAQLLQQQLLLLIACAHALIACVHACIAAASVCATGCRFDLRCSCGCCQQLADIQVLVVVADIQESQGRRQRQQHRRLLDLIA
jgi:hypothetical protein